MISKFKTKVQRIYSMEWRRLQKCQSILTNKLTIVKKFIKT